MCGMTSVTDISLSNVQTFNFTIPGDEASSRGSQATRDPSLPRLPQGRNEHMTLGSRFPYQGSRLPPAVWLQQVDSSRVLMEGP